MSILKLLGLAREEVPADTNNDTDTVRKIVGQLEALGQNEARYVATFAYVLSRVAYADQEISEDETFMMEHLVEELGGLTEAQAVLAVEIAKNQARLFAGTENFLVTRQFRELSSREQREQMLHCLFAVAAADDSISSAEETQVRQIASELGFSDREFVTVRSAYNDKREVVKMMRRTGKSSGVT